MSAPDNKDGNLVTQQEWLRYLLPRDDTGALIDIGKVHHEIHEGDHYQASVFDGDVDIASPKYVRITTPNSAVECHLVYEITANGEFFLEVFEDPTLNAAGAAVDIYNNNRNKPDAATATVFQDTTTQAPNNDGTLMPWGGYSGGDKKKVSVSVAGRIEDILKVNEDYIFKVTAVADNMSLNVKLAWYEEG